MTTSDQNQGSGPQLTVVSPAEKEPVLPEEAVGGKPAQAEMPFAVVSGEPVTQLPQDLYIPPYALKVFLEAFEGPLDLLLYLIRRQNLDVLDIPIADITKQYVDYIEMMQELQLELAGEYLLMAAMLAEIKSRMLLPRSEESEDDEHDPRAELVRRLQEYERFKQAAEDINVLSRMERDHLPVKAESMERKKTVQPPDLDMQELLLAFKDVLARAEMFAHLHVQREPLSIRQRMSEVLTTLTSEHFTEFKDLFDPREGKMGVVVTFMALLELLRESVIELVQAEPYSPIHVRAAAGDKAAAKAVDADEAPDDMDQSDDDATVGNVAE